MDDDVAIGQAHCAHPPSVKDFQSGAHPIWCLGCGDFGVLAGLERALVAHGRPPHEIVLVSGIGCSSRLPAYTSCYGFHGVHGRALAVATGLKLARPDLEVIAVGGDGDGYSIGGNHFIHACRRDVDMLYIVMDNRVYGMTKGQPSPTSEPDWDSDIAPGGIGLRPLNPVALALTAGANFVARGFAGRPDDLADMIVEGIRWPGFAFLEVLSPCVTYRPEQSAWKRAVRPSALAQTSDRATAIANGSPTTGSISASSSAGRAPRRRARAPRRRRSPRSSGSSRSVRERTAFLIGINAFIHRWRMVRPARFSDAKAMSGPTGVGIFTEATMTRFTPRMRMLCGVAGLVALVVALPVSAQMMGPGGWDPGGWGQSGNGWGQGGYGGGPGGMMGRGYGWGPGAMMGPGWRGGGMCSPRAAGLAAWRVGAIEEIVKPTEAQRPALDAFQQASSKAADAMAAACPQDYPATSPARLEAMEKRLDAMLAAVKTVRPAFDAFYAALTDEQKRRLDTISPEGSWRWHMWRWRQSEQ